MNYEALTTEAYAYALAIKEVPFRTYARRIKENNIYIRRDFAKEKGVYWAKNQVIATPYMETYMINQGGKPEARATCPAMGLQ